MVSPLKVTFNKALAGYHLGHLCDLSNRMTADLKSAVTSSLLKPQVCEVQCYQARHSHQLGHTAGLQLDEVKEKQMCLHLVLPCDWESCRLHRDFLSVHLPNISTGTCANWHITVLFG